MIVIFDSEESIELKRNALIALREVRAKVRVLEKHCNSELSLTPVLDSADISESKGDL